MKRISRERLSIEDCGSTNGTCYNSVKINKPQPIKKDGILMIGSMELRVTWDGIMR